MLRGGVSQPFYFNSATGESLWEAPAFGAAHDQATAGDDGGAASAVLPPSVDVGVDVVEGVAGTGAATLVRFIDCIVLPGVRAVR